MIFRNRKRVILDRGPSWPNYAFAEPFVIRYYPFFRKRPSWFPFNILVHKLLKSDLGDLHDHYWSYITIILKGGYWETTDRGAFGENRVIYALEGIITDIVSKSPKEELLGHYSWLDLKEP